MIDYNQAFLDWLEQVRPLDPKKPEDIPDDLTEEFRQLIVGQRTSARTPERTDRKVRKTR